MKNCSRADNSSRVPAARLFLFLRLQRLALRCLHPARKTNLIREVTPHPDAVKLVQAVVMTAAPIIVTASVVAIAGRIVNPK